jgi:hypothetical protein
MAPKKGRKDLDLESHYTKRVKPLLHDTPWVLRITEWQDKPPPLFVIRQRRTLASDKQINGQQTTFVDRGLLYGEAQRRCLPILQKILARVQDAWHQPLELQPYLTEKGLPFRGNLPLDDEAGCKLALIFKLQERVKEIDRVELIARRADRFTREEAAYWLSRISNFGDDANRWASSGLRIMLGGHAKDPAVERMLERLRESA